MPKTLSSELFLFVAGTVITIILVALDKSEKLKGGALIALLIVAGLLTIPLALGNSWVVNSPSQPWKIWRGSLSVCIIVLCYAALIIWISTPAQSGPARIGAYSDESISDPAAVWLQSGQYLAQGFSIPSHFQVEEVRLAFFDNKVRAFAGHLYLTSALGSEIISGGSATASSKVVKGQADITLPVADRPTTVVVPLSASLPSGEYFLVLSTQEPQPGINRIRWRLARLKFRDNFGTVGLSYFSGSQNPSFPPASDFVELGPDLIFEFQILGKADRK